MSPVERSQSDPSAIQEQLLQGMRFWVVGLQRLQQIVDPTQFTTALVLNQAQVCVKL